MFSCLLTFFILAVTALADTPTPSAKSTTDVWPEGKMPGVGAKEPEAEKPSTDGFHRITNVSRPTLALYPAPRKEGAPPPAALIVCPGGGYSYVVIDKEGSEIAAWLNSSGISALVLKYRNPNNRAGALQDIQRALSPTRAHAAEWNIDPKRIGVIGFSAGGNLAAKASAPLADRSYPAIDAVDAQSCRPDCAVLVYPAYLDDKAGHVSPDLNLEASIPPTLIVHSEDDKTHVVGSKIYDAALTEAKVPHEFKLYPTGGHGYGLHCDRDAKAWPQAALDWFQKIGFR
ncbi:MAG TPA: alpha/beta hydrolase [Chthoniobacter sp.]|jgi:acetyl esterase/lipase